MSLNQAGAILEGSASQMPRQREAVAVEKPGQVTTKITPTYVAASDHPGTVAPLWGRSWSVCARRPRRARCALRVGRVVHSKPSSMAPSSRASVAPQLLWPRCLLRPRGASSCVACHARFCCPHAGRPRALHRHAAARGQLAAARRAHARPLAGARPPLVRKHGPIVLKGQSPNLVRNTARSC